MAASLVAVSTHLAFLLSDSGALAVSASPHLHALRSPFLFAACMGFSLPSRRNPCGPSYLMIGVIADRFGDFRKMRKPGSRRLNAPTSPSAHDLTHGPLLRLLSFFLRRLTRQLLALALRSNCFGSTSALVMALWS